QDGSICLFSRRLEFIHPVKKEKIIITAPLPEGDVWEFFKEAVQ
ncbi:MAG TPA: RNA pseudouridine synthase, partial [Bacteroidales bacterium]|nr:RNA pseudouridine synthase [Bacteroidales bacterium]